MRKKAVAIMFAVFVLLTAGYARAEYEVAFSRKAQKSWLEAKKNLPVRLLSILRYRYKDQYGRSYEKSAEQFGNGLVIGKFVITARHVVENSTKEEIADYLRKSKLTFNNLEILGEWYVLEYENSRFGGMDVLRLVFEDEDNDVALLEFLTTSAIPPSLPVKIGNPKKLEDGSFILMGGSPAPLGRHFREGYVSSPAPLYPQLAPPVGHFRKGFYFGINMHVAKGDSGSPVFAITENGSLEWVGIVITLASASADIFTVSRADAILDLVKEKTGIDLRAVQNPSPR